jgi:MinD superfamily P-loop ATPase
MKEVVIISGKGGTGKTSVTAAFACLAQRSVVADCDVDASDLHLLLAPTIRETHEFSGGRMARIRQDACKQCGICFEVCRFGAVVPAQSTEGAPGVPAWQVDAMACEGCGVCVYFCPEHAINLEPTLDGHWFLSDTRVGPMVHARMAAARENSGKLVALVRQAARSIALEQGFDLILVDGPPGTGCPVISSLTGVDHVVVVTEPTAAGVHDLQRVMELAGHFDAPMSLLINKADLNPAASRHIARYALEHQIGLLGEIPYDAVFTQAQLAQQSVVEYSDGPVSQAIGAAWRRLQRSLDELESGQMIRLDNGH